MPSYTHTHEAELRPFTSAPPAPQVFMRNAPVLRMPKGPVRGGPKEAMARKALALAHVRAEEERRTMLWKSHVFEENLKQQTRALMRGATNAARDQRETNLLTASLEMTLATLAGAERSLARTEERVNMHRRLLKEEVVKANKAKRAPPPMPSAPATAEQYYPTGYIEGEQHLEAGQVDPSIAMTRPVYVPERHEPCPQPMMRWPGNLVPGSGKHRQAPRVPVSIAQRQAAVGTRQELLAGQGARDCIAPPNHWGGPYRVRRPEGLIGPKEQVVGLTPKHNPNTVPLRRALEQQYKQVQSGVGLSELYLPR